MLTNLERHILDSIVTKLYHDATMCEDANFAKYLRQIAKPIELVADVTHVYDRQARAMQLESARSLSK